MALVCVRDRIAIPVTLLASHLAFEGCSLICLFPSKRSREAGLRRRLSPNLLTMRRSI